jgi:hypothetical protein
MSSDEFPKSGSDCSMHKLLSGHPLKDVAQLLGEHLRVGCDYVAITEFLAVTAAQVGQPFFQEVISDFVGADLLAAKRILELAPHNVAYPRTTKEVDDLGDNKFSEVCFVLIAQNDKNLFTRVCVQALQDKGGPSVLTIFDHRASTYPVGPCLSLFGNESPRELVGIGHHTGMPETDSQLNAREKLRALLTSVKNVGHLTCFFEKSIKAPIAPDLMILFHRFLRAIASIRIAWTTSANQPQELDCITHADYDLARKLLQALPLCCDDSYLSSHALETANIVYGSLIDGTLKRGPVTDVIDFGCQAFTRNAVQAISGLSYNTIKSHFQQLEDVGILESTRGPQMRGQGRSIFFRFAKERAPPFIVDNPYRFLPTAAEIAADCRSGAQS